MKTYLFIFLLLPFCINAQYPKFGLKNVAVIKYSAKIRARSSIVDTTLHKTKLNYIIEQHITFTDTQPVFWINTLEKAHYVKLPNDTLNTEVFSLMKLFGTVLEIYGRNNVLVGRAFFYKYYGKECSYMFTYEDRDSLVFSLDYKNEDLKEIFTKINTLNLKLVNNLLQEYSNE